MDDIPICPEWWPLMLWRLHYTITPFNGTGGNNPRNFPPPIDSILSALLAHTSSYLMQNKEEAKVIRTAALNSIIKTAEGMKNLPGEISPKQKK